MDNAFTLEETLWDNDFFNIKSSKILLKDNLSSSSFSSLVSICKDFDLVVINNPSVFNSNDLLLSNLKNCTLCDINIQFNLMLKDNINLTPFDYIEISNFYPYSKEIIDLSQTSFIHSRFINDKNLDTTKSKDVHCQWCKNSFNKPDKFFSVYKNNKTILGFTLFSFKNDSATIELIAVNPLFQNKSIGKALINSTLSYLKQYNIKVVFVGTQYSNITAIKFYESLGFKINKIHTIYHYWPNKE